MSLWLAIDHTGCVRQFQARWAEVTIDCRDVARASVFWSEFLDIALVEPGLPGWARTEPTAIGGPVLNFQPVSDPKVHKVRVHLDIWTDDLAAASQWVIDRHGCYTGECHRDDEGTVVVMADPEGNEFCLVGPPGSDPPSN